jgi:hypothetical protein
MTRTLEVELETRHCAFVRGHGSRALLTQMMNGKPPVWSRSQRAWTVSERTARNVIAAAEHQGFNVVITGPRAVQSAQVSPGEHSDPGGGLW